MSCDCWMCLCCAEIFFGAWHAVAANADCRTQNVVHGTNKMLLVGRTDVGVRGAADRFKSRLDGLELNF